MFILVSFKTTFEDVYGSGCNPQEYTGTEYTERINESSFENVSVRDCVFRNISSSENGGALYCSSSVHRLLVEQSSFISCITSYIYGGGIRSNSRQCVLSRICAFNCCSTNSSNSNSYGQFAYINTNDKNHVNDTQLHIH